MTTFSCIAMLSALMALPSLAAHADPAMLKAKLGLWETTATPHMSGQLPISEEQMARIPPEQRAKMEAALQAAMGSPRTSKTCVTADKLRKGFDFDNNNAECQRNVLANSESAMTIHEECSSASGARKIDIHIENKGDDSMTGTVHVQMSQGGKTMNIDETIQGHWLASDCGGVK